jgi:hypothetical protein
MYTLYHRFDSQLNNFGFFLGKDPQKRSCRRYGNACNSELLSILLLGLTHLKIVWFCYLQPQHKFITIYHSSFHIFVGDWHCRAIWFFEDLLHF